MGRTRSYPRAEEIDRASLGFGRLSGSVALQFLRGLAHGLLGLAQFGRNLLAFLPELAHHLAEFPAEPILALVGRIEAAGSG